MKIFQFVGYSAFFKIKKDYFIALENINLSVEEGEFLAITGPSGCGKTTLLRSVMGLVPYYSGELLLNGKKIEEIDVSEQNITYVSQEYTLYPSMTVYENIAYPLKVMGLEESEMDRRVRDIAAQFGLTWLLTRKPRQLSGGQRQRVAVARALVKGPKLALFDEPFSNLEPQLRGELGVLLRDFHRRQGGTFLFVTHDMEEACALADKVVTLEKGEIRRIDAPERRLPELPEEASAWEAPVKTAPRAGRRWRWIILAAALLAAVIGISAFRASTAVPDRERLKISFVGEGLDTQRLEEDLLAALQADGQAVREVLLDSLRYDDGYTQGSAVWVRSREADVMIFLEEFLFDGIGTGYGLTPFDGDITPRLTDYYIGDARCTLFFTDAGLEKSAAKAAAEWLLEVE